MKKRYSVLSLLVIGLLLAGLNAFAADGDLIVNGNVGIGTASPVSQLEVNGNNANGLIGIIFSAASNYQALAIAQSNAGGNSLPTSALFTINNSGNNPYFNFDNLFFMQKSGNVGIGTTTPGDTLSVVGTTYCLLGQWSGSDVRWKKNIEPIGNALSLVDGLQAVRFDWNAEALKARFNKTNTAEGDANSPDDTKIPGIEGRQVGLIAQDVEKVLPELVKTDTDGYKAVSYEKLAVVLLQAVKELKAEVEKLKGQ